MDGGMRARSGIWGVVFHACCVLAGVVLLVAVLAPGAVDLARVQASTVSSAIVALLAAVIAVGGGIGLVRAYRGRDRALESLTSSNDGLISIEPAALVSTVRRSLDRFDEVEVRDVAVDVVRSADEPAVDVRLTVVPLAGCKLMTCARAMQSACKEALEAFTEQKVRTIAVDYVEQHGAARTEDGGRTSPVPADRLADDAADAPVGLSADDADRLSDVPVDMPIDGADQLSDAPVDVPIDGADRLSDGPVDLFVDAPVDMLADVPVGMPADAFVDAAAGGSLDLPVGSFADVPTDAAVDALVGTAIDDPAATPVVDTFEDDDDLRRIDD